MTDLFGNTEPVKPAKPVVRKNRTTENRNAKAEIVPAGIKTEGYDFSQIRKKFHNGKWYFAYMDVVGALAETKALK
ncbi:MAG: hypothetical protein II015_01215, partial [Aeriscardovia sp.]|nr:hypothetical protein [Aeriscardovia sp.]